MQLDYKLEMIRRKEERKARTPADFILLRMKENAKRRKLGLRPFCIRQSRYTGPMLRTIRAETYNWKGELRR